MMRFGLACGVSLALALLGCGDDDSGNQPSGGAKEDGGAHSPPIVKPGSDGGSGSGGAAGDDESEGTVSLGDAGMRLVDCEGAEDGAACGPNGGLLCLAGSCLPSRCGDGFVDPAFEECDDDNTDSGDGCDDDCSWTCESDAMCDDGAACNGKERCLVDHTCELGVMAGDGTACMTASVSDGQCRQGSCTPAGCGDKETKGSEQCDDGNDVAADGCEIDCTFSCEQDADCDDGNVCTGSESCDKSNHVCKAGDPMSCRDQDDCTRDDCDPTAGCIFPLIDEDGDNHAPKSLACGDDCDDSRADVYPGHPEMCDATDHDCDGKPGAPDIKPTWYVDCDGDGFAAPDAASMVACEAPPPDRCGGSWTTRAPDRNDTLSYDCNDLEMRAFPKKPDDDIAWYPDYAAGTTGWEYNCNSMLDLHYANVGVSDTALCTSLGGFTCTGASGWINDKPPKCGLNGLYTECHPVFSHGGVNSCSRTTGDKQQMCR